MKTTLPLVRLIPVHKNSKRPDARFELFPGFTSSFLKSRFFLTVLGALFTLIGAAQTYTTQADGNWTSPATWMGGIVPGSDISAGKIVNINHDVICNLSDDIIISGVLNITGDTLRFGSAFDKKIEVKSGGLLNINNGGFLQNMQSAKSEMNADNGRIIFNNAKISISKNFLAKEGSSRTIKNSTVFIGGKYEIDGSGNNPSVDTIQYSIVETSTLQKTEFSIHSDATLRVANAYIKVNKGADFKNDGNGTISVLAGANSNFGFDYLKVTGKLKNDGNWNARIDAACITGDIEGSQVGAIDFTRSPDCSTTPSIGSAPELIFGNPVLKYGNDKKQGAIYRFANVMTGVDAEIKLKRFSRSDIVIKDIDLSSLGWDKAFQPQFGLEGVVQPNQNWYIDFEVKFYEPGTNTIKIIPKVDMTALDVDGDNWSINEYAAFQNPSNVIYSTLNYLVDQPAGILGQTFICPIDGLISPLITCLGCGGDGKTGLWNLTECSACHGAGALFSLCNHEFDEVSANTLQGPVTNFTNIDTSATQVMATYQFTDVSVIKFRYGAKSGSKSSSAGVRLNSLWFRQFNLSPELTINTLPIKLIDFSATLNKSKVDLKWTTVSEKNVSHFEVERSVDGANYSQAGLVFAYGNTNENKTYAFPDNITNVRSNIIYYRLRSVDNDGKSEYSQVRIVLIGKQNGTTSLIIYPNPVNNELRATVPFAWQGKEVLFEVFNQNGIKIKSMKTSNASQTESITVSGLAKGFYLIKAICGSETAQQKIIKN